MPTVIDSLLVTLGLDASEFNAEQRKAVQNLRGVETQAGRTAEQLRTKGNVGAEFFSALTRGALALGAVLGGASFLKGFASQTMDSVAATGRLAHDIGTTTEKLTTFTGAVWQFAGGTKEGAAQSIAGLNAAVTNMQIGGNPALIQFFTNLGVSVTDAQGHMRDTLDVLNDIGKSAYWKSLTPQQQTFYGQSLGLDKSTIDFLRKSDSEREAAYSKVRAEGVPSDADAAAMQKFQEALRGIEAEFDTFGRNMELQFGPDLIAAGKGFLQSAKDMEAFAKTLKGPLDQFADWMNKNVFGKPGPNQHLNAIGMPVDNPGAPASPATGLPGLFGRASDALNRVHNYLFGDPAQQIMSDLVARGVDPSQAAGIAANAMAESGGDTQAYNPAGGGDGALGLYQWRGQRIKDIQDHFGKRIIDMSISEQNAAMIWDSKRQSGVMDALRSPMSAGDAAGAFDDTFERNGGADRARRVAMAAKIHADWMAAQKTAVAGAKAPKGAPASDGSAASVMARLRATTVDPALKPAAATVAPQRTNNNSQKAGDGSAASVIARLRATTIDPALRPTAATVVQQRTSSTNNNSQTTIGQITVKTAATDADGIAGSIRQAMARYPIVPQANTGLA